MASANAVDRAHMASVYMLVEQTGECERCHEEASVVVAIGVVEDGVRELTTCLPCALDLIVMLSRKGRLHRG